MVKSCEIELAGNPLKVIYSGQKVNGRLSVVIEEPESIESESSYFEHCIGSNFKSIFRNPTSNSRIRSCVFKTI